MTFDIDVGFTQGAFSLELAARGAAKALALVGPSGSGKTTLVEAIAGLRPIARGRIAIDGRVFDDRATGVCLTPADRRVGYVPQDVLLFPHLDVAANLRYGTRAGEPVDEAGIIRLLELEPLMARRPGELSGGERQRVALGRALFSAPRLLLLDEPLSAVDVRHRGRILEALLRVRDTLGLPMVYVTHAPDEVRRLSDYALAIEGGRLVAAGAPDEIRVW
ncbi:MAG: ATP-binding cassette domain-containing protein [Vicinamibacterales bacterium]